VAPRPGLTSGTSTLADSTLEWTQETKTSALTRVRWYCDRAITVYSTKEGQTTAWARFRLIT